jgi:high affinity sulfate transporter 1
MATLSEPTASPRASGGLLPAWLTGYRKEWLTDDLVGGLVTAAVVIPKAMAYATIAGLPVQVGLYTILASMVVYALLGTSRLLNVSTSTTLAILVGAQLTLVVPGADAARTLQACATLTLLTGGVLILASVLRLGFVANFISEPVLVGFKAGVGLVIVFDQIPKLMGVHFEKGGFLHNLVAIVQSVPHAIPATAALGIGTLVLLFALEHYLPKWPAPLFAVALGIGGIAFLGLDSHGVTTVGHLPRGLPSPVAPDFSLAETLWPGALGIALMSFTESIAAARAFAVPGDPPLKPNRELLATGAANVAGAFVGALAIGGGTSQTSVAKHANVQTQLASFVIAAISLLAMLVLAPVIALLPQATLGAIVIVYSLPLIDPAAFRAILHIRRTEFVWAVAAFAGVVFLGTLQGILVAIVVSLVALAYQAAMPQVHVLARKRGTDVFRPVDPANDDETFPGLLMVRPIGRVFFVNAERLGQVITAMVDSQAPRVLALDLSRVPDIEYTALKMLTDAEKRMRDRGVGVWLVGMNPEVLRVVRQSALGTVLGRDRMQFNLESAVTAFQGVRDERRAA